MIEPTVAENGDLPQYRKRIVANILHDRLETYEKSGRGPKSDSSGFRHETALR
ncbi:MAG: hypothetical protein H0W99_06220 [Acidobacteria bacterium]|nr:hypothetical protein [Acidobacteriota bacterium]